MVVIFFLALQDCEERGKTQIAFLFCEIAFTFVPVWNVVFVNLEILGVPRILKAKCSAAVVVEEDTNELLLKDVKHVRSIE